jgi:hypothetical protein
MADGTVRVTGLNLRDSLTTGPVVKVLRKSSRVEILGEETWLRVRTRDGLPGYVFGDFIERDAPPEVEVDAASPSKKLVLERYHHERFVGSPVTADVDFFPLLDRIAGFAAASRLFVHVTSSTRDPGGQVSGAIVEPAKRSNHFVGHAIDMNLLDESGKLFTSAELKDLDHQPEAVRRFIELVRTDADLRWGGDFGTPDVVHIDDGLNLRQPEVWEAKLASRA